MAYNITFNGYALQDTSFRTRIIQHTNIPTKMIQAEPRARADGLTIVNVRYSARTIEVEGQVTAASRQALVAKIDEMKLNLSGVSGVLIVDYGTGSRTYYATVDQLDLPEDFYNITSVPYKISFFCADPFGYATTSGNLSFTGRTQLLFDQLITMSGNIDSDPVIQLTLNSVTSMSLLSVSNESTGETIIINKPGGNFANSDVVLIDSVRKRVYINNSGVDYTGQFPRLAVGSTQRLRVAMIAGSANYDIVTVYSPRFL